MTNEEKARVFYYQLPLMTSIGKITNSEKLHKALANNNGTETTIQVPLPIQQDVLNELLKIVDSSVEIVNESRSYNHYPPHWQSIVLSRLLSYLVSVGLKTTINKRESVVKYLIGLAFSFEPTPEETT